MDTQEAKSLLTEELAKYRARSYADLVAIIGEAERAQVTGPSGKWYQVEVNALWDARVGGDVRVVASIDDGGLRAIVPLSDDFIKATDGTFIGEG